MIKVSALFSYSFGKVAAVSNFWTINDEIVRIYVELTLPSKQNCRLKIFEFMVISPTWQDVLQM